MLRLKYNNKRRRSIKENKLRIYVCTHGYTFHVFKALYDTTFTTRILYLFQVKLQKVFKLMINNIKYMLNIMDWKSKWSSYHTCIYVKFMS